MPTASKVILNEIDQTYAPSNVSVGISGIIGQFKRGPINDPSIIVQSWNQFLKIFGGFVTGFDDAILVKRAFDRGTTLRIANVRHYTDLTNASTLTAVKAALSTSKSLKAASALVTLNLVTVTINTSNVVTQAFDTTSDNTWVLLAKKIVALFPNLVVKCSYLGSGSNKLILVPATGVTLTATAVVTLGASQPAITSASVNNISSSTPTELFQLTPKYPGSDYNNIIYGIEDASNGDANSFNLVIQHLLEPTLNESWPNIKIIGNPNVANSTYLADVIAGSQLVDVTYLDLSATSGQQRPVDIYLKLDTGTDGGAVVDLDVIGDPSTRTGFYAFDGIGDMFEIGAVSSSAAVLQAGANYVTTRQDLVFYGHLNNNLVTAAALVAAKDALLIDASYAAIFAGGLKIIDPVNGLSRNISEIGDILGASGYSNAKFGPWYSFAGTNRGLIFNALGVVNNFALDSQYNDRNLLANHMINIVGNVDGLIQIMGNFTSQQSQSLLSYISVRKMVIYVKKVLSPVLKRFIEEPNDIKTWKNIYQTVKPTFKSLKDKRAIFDWDWQGDQFAPSITKLNVNNNADVDAGKYKVKLFIKPINSLQELTIDITLTRSSVSFEDNLSSLSQTAA